MFRFNYFLLFYISYVFCNTTPHKGLHPSELGKQNYQQLQLVVVPPPSYQPLHTNTPSPAAPGYVWVQVPIPNNSSVQSPIPQTPNLPSTPPNLVSSLQPTIQQPVQPPSLPSQPVQSISTSPLPTVNVDSSQCIRPRGQFPSTSCDKYVNCWDGHAVEQSCPEGLLFNPKGYCDYPNNVNCQGRPILGGSPVVTGAIPPTTPVYYPPTTSVPPTVIATLPTVDLNLKKKCLKPRGQFPSDSCNKYVNCWDDVIIEQECPEGLLFSSKGYCDYPDKVNCDKKVPSRNSNNNNSNIGDIECLADYGTFRDRKNCSLYYTCIGGKKAATYACPEGFKYNDNIGVCDYAARVDCSRPPLIHTGRVLDQDRKAFYSLVKDVLSKMSRNCSSGQITRVTSECSSVAICRNSAIEIVQCPRGMGYNIETDKCVLLHKAKC